MNFIVEIKHNIKGVFEEGELIIWFRERIKFAESEGIVIKWEFQG